MNFQEFLYVIFLMVFLIGLCVVLAGIWELLLYIIRKADKLVRRKLKNDVVEIKLDNLGDLVEDYCCLCMERSDIQNTYNNSGERYGADNYRRDMKDVNKSIEGVKCKIKNVL